MAEPISVQSPNTKQALAYTALSHGIRATSALLFLLGHILYTGRHYSGLMTFFFMLQ